VLQSGDWRVRSAAATALGFTNSARAVAPLIAALQNDANAVVRTAAASALDWSADERAIGALTRALIHDEDVRVRQASVHSLFHLAIQRHVGVEILPALVIAAHDAGTIGGHPVVGPIAQKTIDEMKLWRSEPGQ
jgi:HEAT repeat protein